MAALAASPAAGKRFGQLSRQWTLGTPEQRQALDDELRRFAATDADPSLVRMAKVLLAFNALDRGEEQAARGLARSALLGPPGTARDLGSLIFGSADRRRGQYEAALERLTPLMHKLIDPFATELLDEELVRAALGAERYQDAVRFMAIWLRETDLASRRKVAQKVERLLGEVASEKLLRSLTELSTGEQAAADREMARLIAGRLATAARQAQDASLARALLERFGGLLGSQGEAVARLAADAGRGRVRARTLGVLLSLRSSVHRRRSADVIAGMAFGLRMPGSGARLVSRDGGSNAEERRGALRELAAEGAAVIVAGLDAGAASETVEFAAAEQLPVILLSAGGGVHSDGAVHLFWLGTPAGRSAALLMGALRSAGARRVVGFGREPGLADEAPPEAPAEGRVVGAGPDRALGTIAELDCPVQAPAEALRALRVDGLLVRDGAACGADLLGMRATLRASLAVGLGVRELAGRLPDSALVLDAGHFPVDPRHPGPALQVWLESGRGPPSWWTALGRDAAVLGWKAIEAIEGEATDDPREVKARRAEAAARLASASAELWTSSARGFGPDRRLARDLVVRRAGGGGAAR